MPDRIKQTDDGLLFECPGCGSLHAVTVDRPNGMGARWTWNGSLESPTFQPSILARVVDSKDRVRSVCHSFVTDGKIQFLDDCTHSLAGQTVDLPLWDGG